MPLNKKPNQTIFDILILDIPKINFLAGTVEYTDCISAEG